MTNVPAEADWTLHRQNLAVIEARLPQLAPLLASHKPLGALVRGIDDGWDVAYDTTKLYYPKTHQSFAEEQLKNFLDTPHRSEQKPPDTSKLDRHGGAFITAMLHACNNQSITFSAHQSGHQAYFLFVFGFGLGGFVESLVKQAEASLAVIIEPNLDFLYFSTFILDWSALFTLCDGPESCEFRFIISSNPEEVALTCKAIIRESCPSAWDGALHYRHYTSALMDNIFDRFNATMTTTALLGLGFLEDELTMVRQARQNLTAMDRLIVASDMRAAHDAPVVIVGNGPSLDQALPFLKPLAEGAIIISCGSALPVLLDHGIRPDFQVVIERGIFQLESCSRAQSIAGLDGVTLLGSTTVRPEVAALFNDVWLYFRPCLSSTPLFADRPEDILYYTDPMTANSAFNLALHFGFKTVYLVGVDLGSRQPDRDHSAAYVRPDRPGAEVNFETVIPGNFGGDIHSNNVLLWSKDLLEAAAASTAPGRTFFNCSDGAALRGFVPKHISAAKSSPQSVDRAAIKADLKSKLRIYPANRSQATFDASNLPVSVTKKLEEIKAICSKDWDIGGPRAITQIMRALNLSSFAVPTEMILRGTLTLSLAGLHFYAQRVRGEAELAAYRELTQALFIDFLDQIGKEIIEDLSENPNLG